MATKRFEDLEVWVKAKDFSINIYKLTDDGELKKDFGLKDQLRRASISIVSNIAEGHERNGNREFIQFLSYAKGSAGEIRAQLQVAFGVGYIDEKTLVKLNTKITEISKMLSGFITYLKNSEYKGTKFVQEVGQELNNEDYTSEP